MLKPFYAILIIAVVPAAGSVILKVPPATVKSPPKSRTAIALLLLLELYIKAPLAVSDALVHVGSAASKYAVVHLWLLLQMLK